jgi:L-ascorbate metabolism protein UlaG (beta-lactamase superfamily)
MTAGLCVAAPAERRDTLLWPYFLNFENQSVEHAMFRFAGLFCVAGLILTTVLGTKAQNTQPSGRITPAPNDSFLTEIQARGGYPARPGNVHIEFFGHNAFRITTPEGLTILTDPWRNDPTGHYPKWFLHKFPAVRVDIVLSTHAHFDHDAVDAPDARMVLDRLAGEFKLGDVDIMGLADKHQCESTPCPAKNETGFENAIQIIATGGLRIAIWGDNRAVPDPVLDPYLKNLDVLILPIDTVLTRTEADAIIAKYDPRAVIPSHYFIDGFTTTASGVTSSEGWVSEQEKSHHADVHRLDRPDLTVKPADFIGSHHRIYYFGNHIVTKGQ